MDFFFGKDGILRIDGRFKYVDFLEVVKYFIVFFKKGYVISFVIVYYYSLVEYQGRGMIY